MPVEKIQQSMTDLGIRESQWVANTEVGGQVGLGIGPANLDAASPIVFPPVVPVVLHLPKMYDKNTKMLFIMKNMVECYSKSISGIDLNYTVEFDETPVGHDGQVMQFPRKSKRAAVSPSIEYQELIGNPFWNVHRMWITDFADPDTNYSYIGLDDTIQVIPSDYSMSILFIQFDLTGRPDNIIDAFIISNMFPNETGALGSEKNVAETKAISRSIQYSGLIHHNDTIRTMAKEVAEAMNVHTIKYFKDNVTVQFGVEGHVDTAIQESGLAKEITDYLEDASSPS